jgi:3-oxoacyl-[acyl-carrier protein] reductase
MTDQPTIRIRPAVVVTGAAAGIGAAVAARFVAGGWDVLALDRDVGALERAWAEEPRVRHAAVDVRDEGALEAAFGDCGELRACINVAGVYPPSTFVGASRDEMNLNFDVNVWGTIAVTQHALPHLRAGGGGVIVNFASIGAYTATGTLTLYKASKAAVVSLTRSMAVELAPDIRVVGIAPGSVATAQALAGGGPQSFDGSIPLGRPAHPDELAAWCWALAGDDPLPYITGETIVISGGAFIR